MSIFFDPITLIALAVAAFAGFKLWQVLGRGGGIKFSPVTNLVTQKSDLELKAVEVAPRIIWQGFAEKDSDLAKQLQLIADKDKEFDTAQFVKQAQQVHENVLDAFAQGDLTKLQKMLSKSAYDVFAAEIASRKDAGQTTVFKFIQLVKSEIKSAELKNNQAQIELGFTSEFVSAIKDAKGNVTSGNEKTIARNDERWTFGCDLERTPGQWRLTETHDLQ